MKWYKYDIRDLSTTEYKKWYSLMSTEKQYRVDRFRFEVDQKRTVIGEMLARKAISEWSNVSTENIVFSKNQYGKPFALDLNVEFNISHSGNMVVCVVDIAPVGIDIELIRPINYSIIERVCSEDELRYIFGDEISVMTVDKIYDYNLLNRFFKIWTEKESYFKCIGKGINDFKTDMLSLKYIELQVEKNYCCSIAKRSFDDKSANN